MKILAIRIKNLASLEGNTEIDFTTEPLCSAGIFAITGATGAGKSTILDALCLALYSKTPRYLQARETGIEIQDVLGSKLSQGDIRGILRDGAADGFAEVDFIGVDGQKYRANWSVRRARNKAEGSMQSDSVTLKNITSNTDIPGRKTEILKEIEWLVGLSFDQFTRSVLLAQGDFTAFLKANKDEKSSLLEKLTGTHIYSEISKRIFESHKQEETQLRELNIRKEGIVTLSEEETKDLKEEQIELESLIKLLEKEVETLVKEINWHEQLAQLQVSRDKSDIAWQHSVNAKTTATPIRQKLFMVEQVQKTRTWADALNNAQQQHAGKTIILSALAENISALGRENQKLEKELLDSETDLASKNKAFNDALPQLEKAKKLDIVLFEKGNQLTKAKEEAENALEKNRKHQKILENKQTELEDLSTEIKIIEDWKIENTDRRPIADNKDIILSKLQDAKKLLEILQSSTKELDELKKKLLATETQKTEVEKNFGKQTQEWQSFKKIYDSQSKELVLVPIETLNFDKNEIDHTVENTIKAQANWQLLYTLQTDFENLNQKQLKDQSDHEVKAEALLKIGKRLVIEDARKESSVQLLQQARLAATENVETLRAGLTDNEPCPVCGSNSHPYVEHNPKLENVLATLEKTHLENEHIYLASYRNHTALEQECKMLQQTIQHQSQAIIDKQSLLEVKKQEWYKFDVANESDLIADENKIEWLIKKLQILKTKQVDLTTQIQAYASQKLTLEADKTRLDQLKETIDGLANQIKEVTNHILLYREQQAGKNRERENAASALGGVKEILSPYFKASNWMEKWKAAPIEFLDQIATFAEKWTQNTKKLDLYSYQQGVVKATLQELESQAKRFLAETSQKQETYTLLNITYKDLKEQRNTIFDGQAYEEIEIRLKQYIKDTQQKLDENKLKLQEHTVNIIKVNTQKEELLSALTTLEATAKTFSQKIKDWLEEYNQINNQSLNMIDLDKLLLLGSDWIDTQRTTIQTIDDEVTKAASVLAERNEHLTAHTKKCLSERPLDELNELIVAARSQSEEKKHKKGEISFKLRQDEANKNKIGNLLHDIALQAAIAENWSKLNEIIGSADGKKFRQIAQEYTLDVLLGYANIHLKVLTVRYRIERIPTSLGLQVVDQDMGDEVRTVYSLSGGESFLVSLALALGLASLSSSRMKVESLFIDEGFGSLDPSTLNIAMDALERLHNQGRKVGVISHVQEMTERIPVQIKVSKQQSGKSKVEVLGM